MRIMAQRALESNEEIVTVVIFFIFFKLLTLYVLI